jgi:heptosyltransferase-2
MYEVESPELAKLLEKPDLRILTVVRDHMSGILYAVPYIRALRERFPDAKISLLANPYATPILEGCPYLDRIVPFFLFQQEAGRYPRLNGYVNKARAWAQLVGRVDIVVHFRNVGGQTLAFCEMLGRPVQIGYRQNRFNKFLDINLGREISNTESRLKNARILEPLGMKDVSPKMELWLSDEEIEWAEKFLYAHGVTEGDRVFVIHPGCHWGCNQWLPHSWSAVGDALIERYGGKVVITGDENEIALAEKIAGGMQSEAIIAAGETSLRQFAALLGRADLVAAVDTAPTQICLALETPTVILKGEGNAIWNSALPGERLEFLHYWRPDQEENLHCDFAAGACNGPQCSSRLVGISPQDVLEKVDEFLSVVSE